MKPYIKNFFTSYNKVVLSVALIYLPIKILYTLAIYHVLGLETAREFVNDGVFALVDFLLIPFIGYLVMKHYNIRLYYEKRKNYRERTIPGYVPNNKDKGLE